MDLNFELILTLLFIGSTLFWLSNRLLIKQRQGVVEFIGSLAPILGVVLILRSFILEPFQIPTRSMVPTLKAGDFILVNKWVYGLRLPAVRTKIVDISSPERGDVVVFFPPHQDRYFIKRLVGLPGDKINVINGVLYVNNQKMQQTAVPEEPQSPRTVVMTENLDGVQHLMQKRSSPTRLSQNFSTIVPEGHYFMMGDNRDNSSDSRVWGPVPESHLVGKAFARWMFWDKFASIPSFDRVGRIF
jgi:signal peptidase I